MRAFPVLEEYERAGIEALVREIPVRISQEAFLESFPVETQKHLLNHGWEFKLEHTQLLGESIPDLDFIKYSYCITLALDISEHPSAVAAIGKDAYLDPGLALVWFEFNLMDFP